MSTLKGKKQFWSAGHNTMHGARCGRSNLTNAAMFGKKEQNEMRRTAPDLACGRRNMKKIKMNKRTQKKHVLERRGNIMNLNAGKKGILQDPGLERRHFGLQIRWQGLPPDGSGRGMENVGGLATCCGGLVNMGQEETPLLGINFRSPITQQNALLWPPNANCLFSLNGKKNRSN